mmetsp:Transcript_13276/g.21598  ORF Transcript_13276/g.21598 Transcript_13276/m.21598 type:complete len:401 (+) Transcript_13276:1-1203(+)
MPHTMMVQLIDLYLEPWISHYHSNSKTTTASPVTTYTSADFDLLELELRSNAIRVQIFDGKVVYRDVCNHGKGGAWYTEQRVNGVLEILKKLAPHLNTTKKIELFVSYRDHPKFTDNSMTLLHNFPYFATHSSPRAFVDILFPDPLDNSATYDASSINTKIMPYSERIDKVFFRGKFTSFVAHGKDVLPSGRVKIHKISDQYPHLFDSGLVGAAVYKMEALGGFEGLMHYLQSSPRTETSPADANNFKFQLDLDGGLGSCRTVGILKSGSVLLKVMSPFQQFSDPFLVPFKHYIPVDQHMHYIKPITEWCLKNPILMESIATEAADFASQFHSPEGRSLYWKILLEKYALLMDAPTTTTSGDVDNRSPFQPVPDHLCDFYEEHRDSCPAMLGCYLGWKEV